MEAWLKPMLCDVADVVPTGDEWVIERKLDGWRGVFHRTANGVDLYGGRNGSSYTGKLPYIEGVLNRLPDDTAIDGELIAPDGWGSVQGTMTRGGSAPHEPDDSNPPLRFMAFDILRVNGQDVRSLPWTERRALLEQAGFNGPLVFTSEAVPAEERVHELWLSEGFEGSVAKRTTARYTPGRGGGWVKIKPQQTDEATVIGFKRGEPGSEFDGTLGAIEFKLLGNGAESRCSGMDRRTRDEIWANQGAWLGATIEVKHHGLGKTGIPRHPQFLRKRDDRDPAPAPARAPRTAPASNGAARGLRPRNYKAMGTAKLMDVLAQLEGGYGEATDRAENKHTGLDNELTLARLAALEKGLL